MKNKNLRWLSALLFAVFGLASLLAWGSRSAVAPRAPLSRVGHAIANPVLNPNKVKTAFAKLPLHFEVNQGQTDRQVKFLSRGKGYRLFLTSNEAVLSLSQLRNADCGLRNEEPSTPNPKSAVLRMRLVSANTQSQVISLEKLPGKVNYFIGDDPSKWRTNVPTYAKVKYEEVYPGVDVVYYGNQQQLEYDFIIAPGADPDTITLEFEGTNKVEVDDQGDLILHTAQGQVRQQKPFIYQEVDGERKEVSGGQVLNPKSQRVGFWVSEYDPTKPLIIDPTLVYSTFLGGSLGDEGRGIAVDNQGNAYVTGVTVSSDFPTTGNAFQEGTGGIEINPDSDAFVTKLSADGSTLVYSTYLDGNRDDEANDIAVNGSGEAFVAGFTEGSFPVLNPVQVFGGVRDAFVTKLNADGSALIFSTYLGGAFDDQANDIAVDDGGNAYVTGTTNSDDFPTTSTAFRRNKRDLSDAFVTKLDAAGNFFSYSTFLGGNGDEEGRGIALDSSDNVYITGRTDSTNLPTRGPRILPFGALAAFQDDYQGGPADAFVASFFPEGSGNGSLRYSTYLGGNGTDAGNAVVVDPNGRAVVTGVTGSFNFPLKSAVDMTNQINEAFVTTLNETGTDLVSSTFLGGSGTEVGRGITLDPTNVFVWVTGSTTSLNFPTSADAFQPNLKDATDAFVTRMRVGSTALHFSTYLGGSSTDDGFDIATDPDGNVYVTGRTFSANFPIAGNPVQPFLSSASDAFVAKISAPPTGSPIPPHVAGFAGSWAGLTQKCKGSGTKLKCLINGVLNVHNPGDETAAQSVIWFFLSNDETLDEGDLLLDEVKVGPLEAGETEEINLHVKLSTGQSASGQFGIAVLDATNVVPEQNEENNIVVSLAIP